MKVRFNRVELLLPQDEMADMIRVMEDLFDTKMATPDLIESEQVLASVNYDLGFEVFGPAGPTSPLQARLDANGGKATVGPIVWEVDDIEEARARILEKGYTIVYEFETDDVHQLHLDRDEMHGFGITFTQLKHRHR